MSETEIPQSDRLGDYPHPREVAGFQGQADAERALFDAFMSGRMQHAWLLTGPKGIGKATLAYRMARFVLHYGTPEAARAAGASDLSVPLDSTAFNQIAAGSHPNLITVRRPWDEKTKKLKTVITVDEVRRIAHFFGLTASERGAWRVVVIDSADEMNANAANALLKALEEPPPNGLFLVLSHQPGRLLPTIRSRCRTLRMTPLGTEDIAAMIADAEREAEARASNSRKKVTATPEAERMQLAYLSEGSLGRALSIAGSGGLALYRELASLLAQLPRPDIAALHAFADKAGKRGADDTYETMIELLTHWLQRLVRAGAGLDPGPDIVEGEGAAMRRLAAGGSLDRWVEVWEKISQITARGEALNTDRKLVILNVFSMLEAVANERTGA
ncbi:DNA polymerase III subunit delta' [Parvibaculum sp.]|jgi:DNA polymerase III subunit delta'|uniref:DNA polymerase III subunit delta' n=1 Tax=Parvibaculum sp. TaxID=2024848 RepID=UPI000C37F3B5|nr:DNA polymerase III subunit delta' [Parvibaculum sp.]MAM93593.1 DNA polymerase III subunit delta' [Parvibaculum sp.]HCX68936.1 DNA polymerase III subunit delta' [Rhodobiaceae bacterium]|tara:strand:+ start:3105 stop:4268 length:1164 start_codon:yes stop_codon:yes gene_type:complete